MKIGLEIHQQLNTKKLFCDDESKLYDDDIFPTIVRRLHAVKGELGLTDEAAMSQEKKSLQYRYEITPNSCMVEWDEEPPHNVNGEALQTAITVARLLNTHIVDTFFVMRKIVIDGSNTSGFQRTIMVAKDGYIVLNGNKYNIETICLEEDACRKIRTEKNELIYRLDRLGIPLIEIATAPDIHTPEEAKEVAEYIGMVLRRTGMVKRGIGTIREDLNISIEGGNRVEIKGIQDLSMIPKYVNEEVERENNLLKVKEILHERGYADFPFKMVDMTDLGKRINSHVIKENLEEGSLLSLILPNFKGLMGKDIGITRKVLGPEFAAISRYHGAKGIFHSDELPGYGIDAGNLNDIYAYLGIDRAKDGFVLFAGEVAIGKRILKDIYERAKYAYTGIPKETRDPLPDGTSAYSRVLSGMHRMYPETDILPVTNNFDMQSKLPEMPDKVVNDLAESFHLNKKVAWFIMKKAYDDDFKKLATVCMDYSLILKIIEEVIPLLEKNGIEVIDLYNSFLEVVTAYNKGLFAREAMVDIAYTTKLENISIDEAMLKLGIKSISTEDVYKIVDEIINKKRDFIYRTGYERSLKPIMGEVMKEIRGRYSGKEIMEIVREKLSLCF